MKLKGVRKIHPLKIGDARLTMNSWVLKNLVYIQYEMPEHILAALTDIQPNLFKDAELLSKRLETAVPDKTILLEDTEIYTLYLAYDFLGRLLASSYRDQVMIAFRDDGAQTYTPEFLERLLRYALVNIAPMLEETDTYARRFKCLKDLPEIKRKLRKMPVLE